MRRHELWESLDWQLENVRILSEKQKDDPKYRRFIEDITKKYQYGSKGKYYFKGIAWFKKFLYFCIHKPLLELKARICMSQESDIS